MIKKKTKKIYYLIIFNIIFLTLLYFYNNLYYLNYKRIEESTWKCYGDNERSQICEFTNFCIDRINGPFVISKNKKVPKINLINTGKDEDIWFSPKIINSKFLNFGKFNNEKLFVYGLYSPYHFSHFLYNGIIPLYSTIINNIKDNNYEKIWLLRGATFDNKNTEIDMNYIKFEKDIVLNDKDVLTNKQMLPPYIPLCFSKAIVGTGNSCSLWYCENQIKQKDYENFKNDIFDYSENKNDKCLEFSKKVYNNGSVNIGILNRYKSRHITNIKDLINEIIIKVPNVSIKTINFDVGCSIKNTAEIVKDLDVLIAPFGNGLGSGIFMKENSILISINARWYSEDWFHWPMTSIGRRIYSFECTNSKCQENDIDLLEKLLNIKNIQLNEKEKKILMTEENPYKILTPYIPNNEWTIVQQYRKDSKRKVDIDNFIPFLKDLLKDYPNNKTFLELCEKKKML
jgi:hypothetical protein